MRLRANKTKISPCPSRTEIIMITITIIIISYSRWHFYSLRFILLYIIITILFCSGIWISLRQRERSRSCLCVAMLEANTSHQLRGKQEVLLVLGATLNMPINTHFWKYCEFSQIFCIYPIWLELYTHRFAHKMNTMTALWPRNRIIFFVLQFFLLILHRFANIQIVF